MIPSSAPQPPMEILTIAPSGVVNIVSRDTQTPPLNAGFTEPFAVDSRMAAVYFVESNTLRNVALKNPDSVRVSVNVFLSCVICHTWPICNNVLLLYTTTPRC